MNGQDTIPTAALAIDNNPPVLAQQAEQPPSLDDPERPLREATAAVLDGEAVGRLRRLQQQRDQAARQREEATAQAQQQEERIKARLGEGNNVDSLERQKAADLALAARLGERIQAIERLIVEQRAVCREEMVRVLFETLNATIAALRSHAGSLRKEAESLAREPLTRCRVASEAADRLGLARGDGYTGPASASRLLLGNAQRRWGMNLTELLNDEEPKRGA